MSKMLDFVYSQEAEPHRIRTKKILKEKPEIRELIGKNPYTFLIVIGLVVLQTGVAFLLRDQSWWMVFGIAYLVGAFADHALFVGIHECVHKLVFKNPMANRWAALFANLPQVFATAISFEKYHIKHHSFQGVHELDGDLPNRWEAKLINNYFIGKAIWLLFYPFFQLFRIPRLKEIQAFDSWTGLNWLIQLTFTAGIIYFMGWHSLVYLIASFFFSVGLHPLGARWVQEHYLTEEGHQETHSYYGPLNKLAFNVGFHNEHHDFPSVPWNRLPQIRETAPNFYNSLTYHTSWTKLFFRFLFDKEISLFSRVARRERGKVPLADVSKPDVELMHVN